MPSVTNTTRYTIAIILRTHIRMISHDLIRIRIRQTGLDRRGLTNTVTYGHIFLTLTR